MPVKENYGGIVQIAALYHFLEEYGYEPFLIRKKYDEIPWKIILRYILTHNPFYWIYDYKNLTKRRKRAEPLEKFIENFFKNKTKPIYNKADYIKYTNNFNTIIVGSDQVWRYAYIRSDFRYYFLDFLPSSTKRISYAASFGVDNWEGNINTIQTVQKLLTEFNAISVREKSGLNICKSVFNINTAAHVLDPTFLPEIEFYNEIIGGEKFTRKIGLFSYVLDSTDDIKNALNYVSERLGIPIKAIRLTDYNNTINPSVSEWLYNFREAKFIVTDSFHGVVFSILFKKQFICVGNKKRGYTRFESLLNLFELNDRLVFNFEDTNLKKILDNPIDYSRVEVLKNENKERSKNFLLQSLNNE